MELVAGAIVVFLAAFLGGVTGFGYSFVAAPLLLLLGFPLAFVVTANLSVALFTRIPTVYRFRRHLSRKRATGLILGSIPGLWLGVRALTTISEDALKIVAGVVVMVVAVVLARSRAAGPPKPIPGAAVAAGFCGGFFGSATSLNGVGPVLLLARDRASALSFQADLGAYFVAVNAIGLAALWQGGAISEEALSRAFIAWLPASLAGNLIGTGLSPRLPAETFRKLTLAVIFIAGAVTAATART